MNILIAPDSFKDCLSSIDVANPLFNGIKEILPRANIILFPLSDGGEGTTDILNYHLSGRWEYLIVHDPLQRNIKSRYLILNENNIAVVELAKASGLELLEKNERNPLKTSTHGTGELIRHALEKNISNIILAIGGSATVDGGTGIAFALGFRFFDKENNEFLPTGGTLLNIHRIDTSNVHPFLPSAQWRIAADVKNRLNGEDGAARVYGRQKGAKEEDIEVLVKGLEHLSQLIKTDTGFDPDQIEGTGAAGGAALFLLAYGNAIIKPGFDIIADLVNFYDVVSKADLVIAGEGSLDRQTKYGKVVSSVAGIAKKFSKPLIVVAGDIKEEKEMLIETFTLMELYTVREYAKSTEDSISKASLYLEKIGKDIARKIKNSSMTL